MGDKAVVFDLDGTLFDTNPEITAAVTTAAREHGIEVKANRNELRGYMGNGLSRFIKRVMTGQRWAEPATELHAAMLNTAMENYGRIYLQRDSLYPYVANTLSMLQDAGWRLAVATNKLERFTLPLLAEFLGQIKFDCVICKDKVENPKPSPEPLEKILDLLQVGRETALIVGDSMVDIVAGKSAGYRATIAVSYGYHQGEDASDLGADYVIDEMRDLSGVLAQLDVK